MREVFNVYAAYAKDKDLRMKSSSGAMFSLLAEHIIKKRGVVYGVVMSSDCYGAEYLRATSISELEAIRGSKYFQVKVGDTYKKIKKDLESGLIVLFTGTGCLVNGLKSFLNRDYKNLVCVDVVCHGTPSPKLWKKYVEYREMENGAKIINVSFRNKEKHNWDGFEMKEIDEVHREVYISRHIDPFFCLFVSNICLRPSCYECTAKSYKISDITIADFWGIDTVAPEMNDNLGVSLVITRSSKGQKLFDSIESTLIRKKVTYEEGVRENQAEYQSYSKPLERDAFFFDMNKMSFKELSKKYNYISIWKKIEKKIKIQIKKWGGE